MGIEEARDASGGSPDFDVVSRQPRFPVTSEQLAEIGRDAAAQFPGRLSRLGTRWLHPAAATRFCEVGVWSASSSGAACDPRCGKGKPTQSSDQAPHSVAAAIDFAAASREAPLERD